MVVITSIADIMVDLAGGSNTPGLSALRSLRLLRVFRLARTWKDLQVRDQVTTCRVVGCWQLSGQPRGLSCNSCGFLS